MPRAGVSASRFDDGWDWVDPQRDDPIDDGLGNQAYYDWSQTGDFRERPRARALRAVPDAEPRRRPDRAARLERAVRAADPVTEAPRARVPVRATAPITPAPVRAAAPIRSPAPVAAVALAGVAPIAEPPAEPIAPARRTVTITGHGDDRFAYTSSRRPGTRSYERAGFKPDRIAMWAVLLCVLMILAAATSAHAALLH